MKKILFAISALVCICMTSCSSNSENKASNDSQLKALTEKYNAFDLNFSQEEFQQAVEVAEGLITSMEQQYKPEQLEVIKQHPLADDPANIEAIGQDGVEMIRSINIMDNILSCCENPDAALQKKMEDMRAHRAKVIG